MIPATPARIGGGSVASATAVDVDAALVELAPGADDAHALARNARRRTMRIGGG